MSRFSAWWTHLGRPGQIAVIILAVFVGFGAIGLAIPSGDDGSGSGGKVSQPGPDQKKVATPIAVKQLPYYRSSWKFTEEKNGTIDVRTDLRDNDQGMKFAEAVCDLTRSSGGTDKDVMVYGARGDGEYDDLAHHVRGSFFSSDSCVSAR